jgi:hypothetical protein
MLPAAFWSCEPETRFHTAGAGLPLRAGSAPGCEPAADPTILPDVVRETSGLAWSRANRSVLWTHNDSGNQPVLFAIDTTGRLVGRVPVTGASLVDWEDLAAAPCDGGNCLYIADIGDNRRARSSVTIYVIPEPAPDAGRTDPARAIEARYPDGAQDAEAIFVLPGGDIYLITKGRHASIALYRLTRAMQQSGAAVTLERVRELHPRPGNQRDRVTGAAASHDGKWVALRTYRTLYLYPADALTRRNDAASSRYDLTPLREIQGESVAFSEDGQLWLTTEAERKKDRPALRQLRCSLGS